MIEFIVFDYLWKAITNTAIRVTKEMFFIGKRYHYAVFHPF